MTPYEAAATLGVSAEKVYSLAAPRGPIPCSRIGRRVSPGALKLLGALGWAISPPPTRYGVSAP